MAKVMKKEYKPEFVPAKKSSDPSAHFDKEFTSEKACDSVVTSKLTEEQAQAANFEGFNYGSK